MQNAHQTPLYFKTHLPLITILHELYILPVLANDAPHSPPRLLTAINVKMLGSLLTRILSTSSLLTYLLLPPPRLVVVAEVTGGAARERDARGNRSLTNQRVRRGG
jgi:hypothetical protein